MNGAINAKEAGHTAPCKRRRQTAMMQMWGHLDDSFPSQKSKRGQGSVVVPVRDVLPQLRLSQHQDSSQLQECLNPVRGVRDWQQRQGLQPENHAKQNVAAVREKSRRNREVRQQQEQEQVAAAAIKIKKVVITPPNSRAMSATSCTKNFVKENVRQASVAAAGKPSPATVHQRKQRDTEAKGWQSKKDFGRVPSYLQTIKLQLAQKAAAEEAAKKAALIPPGMRLLPEEERLEMLALLQQSKAQVEAKIQALPFTLESPSQLRHQSALLERVAEIEEALRTFSRSIVLVKL